MVGPTTWRFKLRRGVKFHDGSTFGADDALFSIERALGRPSQRSFALRGLTSVKKIDEQTIDFVLAAPDAVWPEKLQYVAMMSKAWCQQHGAEKAQDFNGKQEMHTVRNAMGTGPFRLERYEPDVRVTLKRHEAGGAGPTSARQPRQRDLHQHPLRRHAPGGVELGRGRPGARPAVPGRRAPAARAAARGARRSATSAPSTSRSIRRATS
jgi:ABC-type transport system substrate-binding protein